MRPTHWLPPVVWMVVMFTVSTDTGSGEHTSRSLLPLLHWLLPWATADALDTIHVLLRKTGHVSEYAILAALWYRAFRRGRGATEAASAALALAISVGWAALDEWHQSFVPSRTASAADVVLDGASAAVALAVASLGWRAALDRVTAALLWLAAAGGAAALALDLWLGVPPGVLWLSTPAALALLAVRRMLARRRPRPKAGVAGSVEGGVRGAARDP